MARSTSSRQTRRLFRNVSGQDELFEKSYEEELEAQHDQPVKCLGMTFKNDEKRCEYFLEKLRQKLKDPEFRKIEDFRLARTRTLAAFGPAVLHRLSQSLPDRVRGILWSSL